MAAEIAELVKKIGCNEDELRRLLKVDQPYIDHLIARGYSRSEAENISFIGDLRKMVSILNAHTASAAAILKQSRGAPHGFVSTETEGEDDDNEQQVANNEQTINNEDDQEGNADSDNLSSSSSSSGYANSISLSSSTEDEVEAKRLKLDPDYVPSGSSSSSSSTTPAETEPNSRVGSDAEEELEGGETDTDSVVSSVNSQEELEPSDTPEESNDADDEDGEL
jgi:hypothetical protein